MNVIKQSLICSIAILFMASLTACSPEVGSEKWCASMKEKPTGDWSSNEAADYAQHCLLK
jgi:hypothetical protein